MNVSIGMNLQSGPWGGGNQFGLSLAKFLKEQGASVSFDLSSRDLDIILLAEPRRDLRISAYGDAEIFDYLRRVNSKAIVVHRVNECDERKGTTGVNRKLMHANLCADHTVFVSSWLRDLFARQGLRSPSSVILNGSDTSIFNSIGHQRWDRTGPARIVTHHWGANPLKGFDIYEKLDAMLDRPEWKDRIRFTYIGNLPEGFAFQNVEHRAPMQGTELADALREHHIYLTGSQNEPGGHHQNEGGNCGLPILYRLSASMPEYCQGFGIGYTENDFEARLNQMLDEYDSWADKMKEFPRTSESMTDSYFDLFKNLLARRSEILSTRKWSRRLLWRFKQRGVSTP